MDLSQKYVLLQKAPVYKPTALNGKSAEEFLSAGTIVKEIKENEGVVLVESLDPLEDPITKERRTVLADVHVDLLYEISIFSYSLLRAEKDRTLRLIVCRDESWLDEATYVEKGNKVLVIFGEVILYGVVQYIGPLEGEEGNWFGVELEQSEHLGTVIPHAEDGRPHFHCEVGRGVYVTVCSLRLAEAVLENPRPRPKKKKIPMRPIFSVSNCQGSRNFLKSHSVACDRPLEVSDRIVWFDEGLHEPARGTVVFIGKIGRENEEPEVAVDFDAPVGDKNYIGENRKDCSFKVRPGYGKVLRMYEIMREQDFSVSTGSDTSSQALTDNQKPIVRTDLADNKALKPFIVVGDEVVWKQVLPDNTVVAQRGKVLFYGEIPRNKPNLPIVIKFGVSFENACGIENWTGVSSGKQLFECQPSHGRLLNEDQLILARVYDQELRTQQQNKENIATSASGSLNGAPNAHKSVQHIHIQSPTNLITSHNELNGFKVGERVLVLEMLAEKGIGTLRWIGVAKRISHTIRFGIELDIQAGNPGEMAFCGTLGDALTGYYTCFQCKPGHGRFVLPIDVIKLADSGIEDPKAKSNSVDSEEGDWIKVGKHHKVPKANGDPQTHGVVNKIINNASGTLRMFSDFTGLTVPAQSAKPVLSVSAACSNDLQLAPPVFQKEQRVKSRKFGNATIEWLGKIKQVYSAGIRLDSPHPGPETAEGGCLMGIELFDALSGWGAFVPVETLRPIQDNETLSAALQNQMLMQASKTPKGPTEAEIQAAIAEADKNEAILNELKSAVEIFRQMAEEVYLDVGVKEDGISGYVKYLLRSISDTPYSMTAVTLPPEAHSRLAISALVESTAVVQYFPPVFINFRLQPEYLQGALPVFSTVCSWLPDSQFHFMQRAMTEFWADPEYKDQQERLFHTFLKMKELLLQALCIGFNLTFVSQPAINTGLFNNNSLGIVICDSDKDVVANFDKVKKFSEKEEAKERQKSLVDCEICTYGVPPADVTFFSLACKHIFCKACVSAHIKAQLENGNSTAIQCPGDRCGVQHSLHELADVVDREVMERFSTQLLERSLAGMRDIWRCPECSWACIFDKDMLGNNQRYIECPGGCGLRYCPHCRGREHGEEPCLTFEQKRALKLVYDAANAQGKLDLEKQHGRDNIKHALEDYEAEEYIRKNMKICPSCRAPTQKIDGCNKMVCTRCSAYFCYICGVLLDKANPYAHFDRGGCKKFDRM